MLTLKKAMPGGVHPAGNKERSAQTPILTRVPLPPRLYLPLGQHAGADSRPLVSVGDYVLKGQRIGISSTNLSASLHAPTSGHVIAIEDITAPIA
jgi:Na+-translocating ferredoxin:NAD+ oxidoreductase subunit C